MGVATFKIIKPGPFTTIQRLTEQTNVGKSAPTSGAFDRFALKMGNLILKNQLGEPGIEIAGEGAEIQTMNETAIAVTGGSFEVKLNGKQIPRGKTFRTGYLPTLEGKNLVVWIECEATKPIQMELAIE